MINMPSFDATPELKSGVPPEGYYDFSLKVTEYKKSRNHNDMMAAELVIDSGEHMGASVSHLFVFGTEKQFGERMLKSFCVAARTTDGKLDPVFDKENNLKLDESGEPVNPGGFAWRSEVESWKEFVAQFVTTPALRVRARLSHEYDIELSEGTWERRVDKDKFDEHVAGGSRGSKKPKLGSFTQPHGEPVIVFGQANAAKAPKKKTPAFPTMGGDGAADDLDELPF